MRRLLTLTSLACAAVAALTLGAAPALADPPPSNPIILQFEVVCPGMQPFDVNALAPVGFVQGQRLLAIRHVPDQGNLDLVECTATHAIFGTQTVFVQFVKRG